VVVALNIAARKWMCGAGCLPTPFTDFDRQTE
jgi:hypothetical protein